ncbi:MAG: hypothetical protein OEZ47_07630 [Gammaproteobacteria bacterium]|nr:hypothetical protein [Gammaproteobacteria bacterium]
MYRENGVLLANKGAVLNEAQSTIIRETEEIFTSLGDLSAYYEAKESKLPGKAANDESNNSSYNPIRQLDVLEKELLRIYYSPSRASSLEDLIWMRARIRSICKHAPDAALAKIFLDNKRLYSVQHAIHVAVLVELTTSFLNWSNEQIESLVGASLTMNISMGILQDRLQKQSKPLNEQQKNLISAHPTKSVEILKKIGIKDSAWMESVLKHHETPDGLGYPSQLKLENIPISATLLRMADVYCAKISGRSYRNPMLPHIAAKDLFVGIDKEVHSEIVSAFLKILGLFPPGTLVRMSNKEIGIVFKRGEKINTPIVKILLGKNSLKAHSPKIVKADDDKNKIIDIVSHKQLSQKGNFIDLWNL